MGDVRFLLYDKFACAVWSTWRRLRETRSNVNYWEPCISVMSRAASGYGHSGREDPRTGPYKRLIAEGRDLTDLHA